VCSPFQLFAEGGSVWEGDREKEREREREIVVKSLRTGAGAKRLYPLPSSPPKSAYVVTNDTFIFL